MPEMDGPTATARIRALDGPNGKVPIVAMTANVDFADSEQYRGSGMNDCLVKPVTREQLEDVLQRWDAVDAPSEVREPAATWPVPEFATLDTEALAALQSAMGDATAEVLETFLLDADDYLGRLRTATQNSRHSEVIDLAHALRGGAANIGARRLAQACQALEDTARQRSSNANHALALLNDISDAHLELRQQLLDRIPARTGGRHASYASEAAVVRNLRCCCSAVDGPAPAAVCGRGNGLVAASTPAEGAAVVSS